MLFVYLDEVFVVYVTFVLLPLCLIYCAVRWAGDKDLQGLKTDFEHSHRPRWTCSGTGGSSGEGPGARGEGFERKTWPS